MERVYVRNCNQQEVERVLLKMNEDFLALFLSLVFHHLYKTLTEYLLFICLSF